MVAVSLGIAETTDFVSKFQGVLSVNDKLDREEEPTYIIKLQAEDNPNNAEDKRLTIQDVVIIVEDVNDNNPMFTKESYEGAVLENALPGQSVLTVTAIDKDAGNNSVVKYYFINDTQPAGLFEIDSVLGIIKVNMTLVGHAGQYMLAVIAEDQGEPKLNGTSMVNITVHDVNLNPPVITNIPDNNIIKVYEVSFYL